MKNITIFTALVFIAVACGGEKDKKTQLSELKTKQKDLNVQIAKLEKELGTGNNAKTKKVQVFAVSNGDFSHYIEIQGRIEADRNVNASAQMPGVVRGVYVREGDYVAAGQVLAEVDPGTLYQNIQQLKTGLELSTTVFNKQKDLWDQKVGTEIAYLQAKGNKENLERQIAVLYEQLTKTKIVSPIAGTVDEVYLKIGEMASPGAPSIRVVNMTEIKAVADVAEVYSSKIAKGAKVIVHFPDLKKDVEGTVVFASKAINNLNRSFRVEVAFPYFNELRPNMIAIVKIEDYDNTSTMSVPINVVQTGEEGNFVMVAVEENGKKVAKRRKIEVGQIYKGSAEVKSGLKTGDQVVTIGYQDLNEGDLVKL
jgi:membrane fusion protein, multidrug efflux system